MNVAYFWSLGFGEAAGVSSDNRTLAFPTDSINGSSSDKFTSSTMGPKNIKTLMSHISLTHYYKSDKYGAWEIGKFRTRSILEWDWEIAACCIIKIFDALQPFLTI